MNNFILNPGDYLEVRTFAKAADAKTALLDCSPGARLYACHRPMSPTTGHTRFYWEEYTPSFGWNLANRDNIPIKVLEAGEK